MTNEQVSLPRMVWTHLDDRFYHTRMDCPKRLDVRYESREAKRMKRLLGETSVYKPCPDCVLLPKYCAAGEG